METDTENEEETKQDSVATKLIKFLAHFIFHLFLISYFIGATFAYIDFNPKSNKCREPERDANVTSSKWKPHILCQFNWCLGYGFLVILVIMFYVFWLYYWAFKPTIGQRIYDNRIEPFFNRFENFRRNSAPNVATTRLVASLLLVFMLLLGFAIILFLETHQKPEKLPGVVAPVFFIICGYIFSTKRSAIRWRIVITGITMQFLFGVFCIRWSVGRQIFRCLGDKAATFLRYANDGSYFVFGRGLVDAVIFAFAVLPVIFFFSFFISVLYYLGVMQSIIAKLGWLLQKIIGTTICESVNAVANIVMSMTESPMIIRPYIQLLTRSEIHCIMVAGFATVSGSVLAAYLSFGASATNLITSTVMAAPGSLALSKLYMPETEESLVSTERVKLTKSQESSLLDAAATGAVAAIPIVLGIIANLVAFVAFIAFLNGIVNWLALLYGYENINFESIFAKLFIPLAWSMGVPWKDCEVIAKVIATKTIINEFVAYERLGTYMRSGEISDRSAGIATFAICGFANPSSMGILIGALNAMAPTRRVDITAVAFRAFIVGCIVCFMSASFAGILM